MPSVPQGYNVFFDILQQIQDEGLNLPFQDTLNFVGAGVTATDDPGNGRTNVNIPGNVQPHDLLDGSQNQDTVAHPVVAGDLIFGTGSPLWDGLAVGNPGDVLTVVGGFPAWATLPADIDFYQTIQDEGIALAQQPTFNFIGAGVTAVDNPGSNRTDITIPGGGAGTDTFMYGFHSDGSLGGGPDERAGWFSDDETSTLLHAQSFVTFTYTIKRGTVHVGTNSSDGATDLAVEINAIINANTLITVPSSTTGSFDTGAISEIVAINDLTNLNMDRQGSSTFGDYNYHMECER